VSGVARVQMQGRRPARTAAASPTTSGAGLRLAVVVSGRCRDI